MPTWLQWFIAISGILANVTTVIAMLWIREVHVLINSRMTDLITLTKKVARARGRQDERDDAGAKPE
jgi:hypothetical protein